MIEKRKYFRQNISYAERERERENILFKKYDINHTFLEIKLINSESNIFLFFIPQLSQLKITNYCYKLNVYRKNTNRETEFRFVIYHLDYTKYSINITFNKC